MRIGGNQVDIKTKKSSPSMDEWLKVAKSDPRASQVGMFLVHNGVVRETAKAKVRLGEEGTAPVTGMVFSYDEIKVNAAIEETYKLKGVYYVRTWLNEGQLEVGDDIMYVLIGGDIRPNVIDALQFLVQKIKTECVTEIELK
ncbi:molybdenum cofactor biosynthesis protein MoaE [Youngiibacter fragilis]|uniref:molybdenum cofactor biosynthesis protein MoaE n=1 Tax=Youngiibacter fragilis TaxID=1408819 RepID=UPI0005933240|nr:molybdenum cofactor biosynthesis protein MoaE [Youngiibacter fragilis]